MIRCWVFLSTILAFFLAIPSHAQSQKKEPASPSHQPDAKKAALPLSSLTEFSATMVGGLLGNIDELKIYRSGNLMRTEMLDGNYMVTDLETRDTWVVLPDRCAHDPRPSLNTFPFSAFLANQDIQRSPVGTEEVDGHVCQVEEYTITSQHGASMKIKMWEAKDLSGFPIKLEVHRATGTPTTITYKNVTIGRPDPAVFKHPATCTASDKATAKPVNENAISKRPSPSIPVARVFLDAEAGSI